MALKALLPAWVTMGLVVLVVVVRQGADGIPGTFDTFGPLQGKYIPYAYALATHKAGFENCTTKCVEHKSCNTFAYSHMEGICILYARERNQTPVKLDGFTLYVQLRREEDGFFMHGIHYFKLMHQRMIYKEAIKYCDQHFYGGLVSVTGVDMNNFLEKMMRKPVVSEAYIGLDDEKEEGKWVYSNTDQEITYSNWNWKGVWKLKDRNCVIMTIDGTWVMSDCGQPNYFFCQIPLW